MDLEAARKALSKRRTVSSKRVAFFGVAGKSVLLRTCPAGRPFAVIGREGGFAHIQDLKSSASGWIDEAALAQPPMAPETSSPAQPKPFTTDGKPAQRNSGVTADSEVTTQPDRRRPGLFGRGGLFG